MRRRRRKMDLTVDPTIFIYLGIFTFVALIVSFCLSYWCLKGAEIRKLSKTGNTNLVKEVAVKMVEMFKCCFVLSFGYRESDPVPTVWSCSCDVQIYSQALYPGRLVFVIFIIYISTVKLKINFDWILDIGYILVYQNI